jgi:hypothetical protein
MKTLKRAAGLFSLIVLMLAVSNVAIGQEALPGAQPANVAGDWIISSQNEDGRVSTKTIQVKQNGNQLGGHFKGPNQSGSLTGTMHGNHIFFRTNTRNVLRFRGIVNGDTMSGTIMFRGQPSAWRAWRPGGE